jgi:glutamine amidotransferase
MTVIIDYGVGNLFSLKSSLQYIGEDVLVTSDEKIIAESDRIILPGVGAFRDAIKKLSDSGLDDVLKREAKKGKPILGICLGMQLLFDRSYEYGQYEGLGFIRGNVVPIPKTDDDLKIPHIGWNPLIFTDKKSKLYENVKEGDCVYFVHSYFADNCEQSVTAKTEYGSLLTASVEKDNIYGTQFHPEKSGNVGLEILKSFCKL